MRPERREGQNVLSGKLNQAELFQELKVWKIKLFVQP